MSSPVLSRSSSSSSLEFEVTGPDAKVELNEQPFAQTMKDNIHDVISDVMPVIAEGAKGSAGSAIDGSGSLAKRVLQSVPYADRSVDITVAGLKSDAAQTIDQSVDKAEAGSIKAADSSIDASQDTSIKVKKYFSKEKDNP